MGGVIARVHIGFVARRNTITDTVIETMSVADHMADSTAGHAPGNNTLKAQQVINRD